MREPCLCRAADGNNVDEYRGRPGLSLDADGPAQEEVPDLGVIEHLPGCA